MEEQARQAVRAPARGARAVDGVAGDRMPERGEVDADLVRPARDEVELEQRPAGEPLADAVPGDRAPPVRDDGHPLAVLRVAADRRLDPPDARRHRPLREREVGLADAARLELGHDARLGGVVAGDDDQPGRVAVEAVDDPRPRDAGDARRSGRRARAAR